jgi:putative peptidoglycan lipid II flippase
VTATSNGPSEAQAKGSRAAFWVGAGIFLSRISGLLREVVFGAFFGNSAVADVWRWSLRTPNVLQNLLGEGTLSASFIPVYAEMVEEGREEDAGRFAGAVLGIVSAVAWIAALLGIALAPALVATLGAGFEPDQRTLAASLLRILFPMTAVLVSSAWALGVLNSHRRFFVSYAAPVLWNVSIITALVVFGGVYGWGQTDLVVAMSWGALVGSLAQLGAQLPALPRLLPYFRLSVSRTVRGVREALHNFWPVVAARGVVNLSALVDAFLATFLVSGALAMLGYAQTLWIFPISLFGMSIAAAELPELSRMRSAEADRLKEKVRGGLRRVTFLMVPTVFAYLTLGDVFIGAIFQRGEFSSTDTVAVFVVLSAYTLGLLASASSRVLSSTFYALRDTRTPARMAYARVALSIVVGVGLMIPLDRVGAGDLRFGAAGLGLGASLGAWVEFVMLRRALGRILPGHGPGGRIFGRFIGAGALAAAAGFGAKWILGSTVPIRFGLVTAWLGPDSPFLQPTIALGTGLVFGVVYLASTSWMGVGGSLDGLLRR